MTLVKLPIGMFLIAIALAAFTNWIITPLFDNSSGDYAVWRYLNYFMAAATLIALAYNLARKIGLGKGDPDGPITRRYLETNLALYASIVLTGWFFWNWLFGFFPENEPAIVGQVHLASWVLVDPLFYLVSGTTGFRLLREAMAK